MIQEILTGLNFWLLVVFTGAFIWVVRQIIPDKVENTNIWKAVLNIAPALVGGAMACIPALRPIEDNYLQSILIGFIGGTFSQSTYGILRSIAPKKVKQVLGGKTQKKGSK